MISNPLQAKRTRHVLRRIQKNWALYLFLLPAVVLTFMFAYEPMYGVLLAFKKYKASLGIMGSAWADPWYKYFLKFFKSYQFNNTINNTLLLNLYNLLVSFPLPVLLALVINQMQAKRYRKVFQTITYMPHFISTVVMVGLVLIFLSPSSGLIGSLYGLFGAAAPNLMASAASFPHVYVWSEVWQHVGWDSIIYIAALSAVSPELYEAATVDGASRWQRMIHIDIPMLIPTALVLLILRIGNMMNIGFEKVYLMQNDLNLRASEVISTYVYKVGIISAQYSYSAAINMFNTLVNLALLILVNQVIYRLTKNSLW